MDTRLTSRATFEREESEPPPSRRPNSWHWRFNSVIQSTRRLRWPAIVVLICFVAGTIEFVLFRATAHTVAIFTVTQICCGPSMGWTIARFIGLRQKPRTVATVICGLGLVIGIVGILVSVFALLIGNAFTSVSL